MMTGSLRKKSSREAAQGENVRERAEYTVDHEPIYTSWEHVFDAAMRASGVLQQPARGWRRNSRKMRMLLVQVSLMLASGLTMAEPVYQVEIVVFHHLQTSVSVDDQNAGLRIENPAAVEPVSLPTGQLLLIDAVARLGKSKAYRTVLHIGWRQGASRSENIRIGDTPESHETGISGYARLQAGQQIGFNADVTCERDGAIAILRARRSMRVGQLHYIDHPLCGMLAQVVRVRDQTE